MGDPGGVGPEVVAKALPIESESGASTPIVYGDQRILQLELSRYAPAWNAVAVGEPREASKLAEKSIGVLDHGIADPSKVQIGEVTAYSGEAAYQAVVSATRDAMVGTVDAIVTAPLNKKAMHLAGHKFDGHTGLLGHLTNTRNYFMVLGAERLKVIHVSTHVSIAVAATRVKRDRVLECIRAAHAHTRDLGINEPRIAVCGLNPHAGENRLFGDEDEDEIRPAVEDARKEGIAASGPLPGDSCVRQAYEGQWDIVVVQYHDQGHVPMKLVAFDEGVNVTVGLPIVRTSVDHGTAFDIAGKGIANATNMLEAIAYARRLAAVRQSAE
jgi:4-hydroxythreonine-4-phosphate dehydrogenase